MATDCNNIKWEYARPAADVNRFRNPSIEFDTDGFVGSGVTNLSITPAYHWDGGSSLLAANAVGAPDWYYQTGLDCALGATYYFKLHLLGVLGQTYTVAVYDIFPGVVIATTAVVGLGTSEWIDISLPFVPAVGGAMTYRVYAALQAGSPFVVDGIEVVSEPDATYLDGDQDGCLWDGAPHASSSRRLATARGGGVFIDFQTEHKFRINSENGTGLRPVNYYEKNKQNMPGTQTTGLKVDSRVFQLGGVFDAADFNNLRLCRNEFIHNIAPTTFPKIDGAPQPVRWRYTGSEKTLLIKAHYNGGLDCGIAANDGRVERAALRLLANDNPNFYTERSEGPGVWFDYVDNIGVISNFTYGRVDGEWDVLQNTYGGSGKMLAVCIGNDGRVYYGGDFTDINGDATLCYAAIYNPLTDTWAPMAAGAVNGIVRALLALPDGRIMLGGEFTDLGDANGDYVAIYDPITDTFSSLNANPLNGVVRGLDLDPVTGNVIIVGSFTQDAVPTVLNRVTRWTGGAANFTAIGAGVDGALYDVAVRSDGQIIVGGVYTEFLSACDAGSTTWYEIGNVSGVNGNVYMVYVDPDNDTAFAGGAFTQMDGETANMIIQMGDISSGYVQWQQLGGGFTGTSVTGMAKHPDGSYRITGNWTRPNDLYYLNSNIVRWTGSAFAPELIRTSAATIVYCVAIAPNGNEYYGTSDQAGARTPAAGDITITLPEGATYTYPIIEIKKDNDDEGARIFGLENYTTGHRVLFNMLNMLDQEVITLDCENNTLTSSLGRNLGAQPIAGTAPNDFYLVAGDNLILFFVYETADDICIPRIVYHVAYNSVDAAEDND